MSFQRQLTTQFIFSILLPKLSNLNSEKTDNKKLLIQGSSIAGTRIGRL